MQEKVEEKKFIFKTSWDDGRVQDLRLANLLKAYKIPAIFYIPDNCDLSEPQIKSLSSDFEIGGHTVNHPAYLRDLPDDIARYEIGENRKWLRELTGQEINSFCYPRGRYSPRTKEIVAECGFTEGRTTRVLYVELANDRFEQHTSVHVHPARAEYKGTPWLEIAKQQYQKAIANDSYFHIWGHSWEVDKYNLWGELEEFFKYVNENPWNN